MKSSLKEQIKKRASKLRKICTLIAMGGGDNAAHIGGALSCIDFLVCADNIYNYSQSPKSMNSLILSKGHACLSLYSLFVDANFIDIEQVINNFEKDKSKFLGHPCRNKEIGISFSTGSLGNGLAHAAGKALYRMRNQSEESLNLPVTCIVGDGECNEGIVWETLEFISKMQIKNIIIFIDCNGWQQTQKSIYSFDNYVSFVDRLSSFNFSIYELNGHNYEQMYNALEENSDKPKLIIGKTVKGKGYGIFEDNNDWHHGIITQSVFDNL